MNTETKTPAWVQPGTLKIRDEARQLKTDIAGLADKAADILAKDGNADTQAEKLSTVFAKRDVLNAKLGRVKTALMAAVVADANSEAKAAQQAVDEAVAVRRAIRTDWRIQASFTKDGGARKLLTNDPKFWPKELLESEQACARLRERATAAGKLLCSLDFVYYDKNTGTAVQIGGRKTAADCYRAACQIVPELA
jgi:hypothetical protein